MNNEMAEELLGLAKQLTDLNRQLTSRIEDLSYRVQALEGVQHAHLSIIYTLIRTHPNPELVFNVFADYVDIKIDGAKPNLEQAVQGELQRIQKQILKAVNAKG